MSDKTFMTKKLEAAIEEVRANLLDREAAAAVFGLGAMRFGNLIREGAVTLETVELFGRTLFVKASLVDEAKVRTEKAAERAAKAKAKMSPEEKTKVKAEKAAARAAKKAEKDAEKAEAKAERDAAREAAKAAKEEAVAATAKAREAARIAAEISKKAKADAKAAAEAARAAREAMKAEKPVKEPKAPKVEAAEAASKAEPVAEAAPATDDLTGKSIAELRKLAKERGLAPTGSKEALISRLGGTPTEAAPAAAADEADVTLEDLLRAK